MTMNPSTPTTPPAEYRVGDRLVSHLSGYVYKITAVDQGEQQLRFAATWDPEDESGWESFTDAASTFRHLPAETREANRG